MKVKYLHILVDHIEHKTVLWQSLINKISNRKELDSLFETGEDSTYISYECRSLYLLKKVWHFAQKFLFSHIEL